MKLMPKRWRVLSKGTWSLSDRTRIWTHIWLIPKLDTHCGRSDTWCYWWEEERTHSGPVLSSTLFLLFPLTIPTPYRSAPFSPSLQVFSSPSPISSFSSCTFSFSNSLVKSSPVVFHVPKPILCTGDAKLDEIHNLSLKISPSGWDA